VSDHLHESAEFIPCSKQVGHLPAVRPYGYRTQFAHLRHKMSEDLMNLEIVRLIATALDHSTGSIKTVESLDRMVTRTSAILAMHHILLLEMTKVLGELSPDALSRLRDGIQRCHDSSEHADIREGAFKALAMLAHKN
jgi:hypothetical protein